MFTLNFSKFIDGYTLRYTPLGTYSAFCKKNFLSVIEELPLYFLHFQTTMCINYENFNKKYKNPPSPNFNVES